MGVGQPRTSRILYPRKEIGNGGVAPIGEVGGFPGGGVGLSKSFRVTIVFVGGVVMCGEVRMQARHGGRGVSGRGGRGLSLVGWWGCSSVRRGGCADPM